MKKYDLIVFGATGATGGQTAKYLNKFAKQDGIRWAMAGRSQQKLEALVKSLNVTPDGVVVADALDGKSVEEMVQSTEAIINLAGPYALYGEHVYAACAKHGVAYADLAGELLFVREMIDRYGEQAKASGARIIPVAGYEALPFDLGSHMVAQRFVEKYQSQPTLVEAVARFEFEGKVIYPSDGLSGGTWGSAVELLKADNVEGVSDPHLLLHGDNNWLPESSRDYQLLKNAIPKGQGWLAPMVPSPWLNPPVVYRSQEILRAETQQEGYTYREGMDTSGIFPGDKLLKPITSVGLAMTMEAGAQLMKLPTKAPRKMAGKVMEMIGPKPGDGPKEERLDLWSYTINLTAKDDNGNSVKACVIGKGQPGYKSTADIIGEVGILMAKKDKRLPDLAGMLTPATGLGLEVLKDFERARLHFI